MSWDLGGVMRPVGAARLRAGGLALPCTGSAGHGPSPVLAASAALELCLAAGPGPLVCQGGLKIGRVQGQRQVRGAVGAFGAGRQIPRPGPEAAPGLEAVCEVPACGAGRLLRRGGGDTGLALVSGNTTSR